MLGLEMCHFSGSWIALICLWCWGCDEGRLSSFQSNSVLTTFLSPEEKYPSHGENTAQTHREGVAEAVCCLCLLLFLKGCRGTGPCFSNISGSGDAWGGWIMSLEMEKQSHCKCQAPKLVGLTIFNSHPWGDLCPLKNLLWSLGLLCCSSRWPLLVPIWRTGSSCPLRVIIPSCFSSWATKGGFILCALMSSHSFPTFSWELSVPSCCQIRKGKRPLWNGEAEPVEVFQEGLNRAKSPSPWAKAVPPPSSSLGACGFPDAKCSKCFRQDPSVDVPKGCSIHRIDSVWV